MKLKRRKTGGASAAPVQSEAANTNTIRPDTTHPDTKRPDTEHLLEAAHEALGRISADGADSDSGRLAARTGLHETERQSAQPPTRRFRLKARLPARRHGRDAEFATEPGTPAAAKPGSSAAAKPASGQSQDKPHPGDHKGVKINPDYHISLQTMQTAFSECSDVVFREIVATDKSRAFVVYVDGMVKSEEISDHTLMPLFHFPHGEASNENLKRALLLPAQVKDGPTYEAVANDVLQGNAALFIEGRSQVILINAKGGTRRGVEEPQTEALIRGPREGFNENLRTNTALVRFKLKTPQLKMKAFTIGERTQTSVVLSYVEGLIDPKVLQEVEERLQSIEIDAVLESGYLEELIEDQPLSPFPQLQYTERPDTVSAALLEGRFAIFTDGTPFVMIGPVTIWQFFQASEDYYERYFAANLIRWLRIMFLVVALLLPALYVALTTFHQDMLPTTLLLSIAAARESIPFPALVEALIMEISFEALREAGIRLPKTIGQAVSILGALVIGQAAVQAGIVSAPMVIIVSLTGIASFTIPRFNMAISVRLLRFPLMILAGIFGLFGIVVGVMWVAVHLCSLRSFGVPYMSGMAPYRKREQKDILVRAPWWRMTERPSSYSRLTRRRISTEGLPDNKQPGGARP